MRTAYSVLSSDEPCLLISLQRTVTTVVHSKQDHASNTGADISRSADLRRLNLTKEQLVGHKSEFCSSKLVNSSIPHRRCLSCSFCVRVWRCPLHWNRCCDFLHRITPRAKPSSPWRKCTSPANTSCKCANPQHNTTNLHGICMVLSLSSLHLAWRCSVLCASRCSQLCL